MKSLISLMLTVSICSSVVAAEQTLPKGFEEGFIIEDPPEGFEVEVVHMPPPNPVQQVVCAVLRGEKVVRPSMMSMDIADKLHYVDEGEQTVFSGMYREGALSGDSARIKNFEDGYITGQIAAISSLLYSVGIIPDTPDLLSLGINDKSLGFSTLPSRLRALATILLLTNYKEPDPVPVEKIVQVNTESSIDLRRK